MDDGVGGGGGGGGGNENPYPVVAANRGDADGDRSDDRIDCDDGGGAAALLDEVDAEGAGSIECDDEGIPVVWPDGQVEPVVFDLDDAGHAAVSSPPGLTGQVAPAAPWPASSRTDPILRIRHHGPGQSLERAQQFPVHTLRPCAHIQPEAIDGQDIEDRYMSLTTELRLVGDVAMRPDIDGGIHLVELLRDEAPWFEDAISLIERQLRLALFAGRPWLQWRPLCLVGPPGSGKSHLASLIAREAGGASALLSLGGTDDIRVLDGTARGWLSAQPCFPSLVMSQHRIANPVIVLDEVDKVGDSARGRAVHDVLLMMLERSTAFKFFDKCLLADINLSACLWILTANDVSALPRPLLSRLDVVSTRGPAPADFDLVLGNLMAGLASEWRMRLHDLPVIPDRARTVMRSTFARRSSIRLLKRNLEDVLAALVVGMAPRSH